MFDGAGAHQVERAGVGGLDDFLDIGADFAGGGGLPLAQFGIELASEGVHEAVRVVGRGAVSNAGFEGGAWSGLSAVAAHRRVRGSPAWRRGCWPGLHQRWHLESGSRATRDSSRTRHPRAPKG